MKDLGQPDIDPTQDPDNYWMHTFYYNPKDRRLLPPKRVALMGWTINFGSPYSVLLLVIILAVLIMIPRI